MESEVGESQKPKANYKVIPKEMLVPFIMVTSLFALWGIANDITNPMVKAFQEVFLISSTQSSLIQFAFYGGYATMAIPAALFAQKYSYKAGILIGLALYATGALLFIPAASTLNFMWFPISLYILTFGLAFLETTANPYILSMGPEETATQRLNLAQAFNPIGSVVGMFVASKLILGKLWVTQFRAEQMAAHPEYADLLPSEVNGKITAALKEMQTSEAATHLQHQMADVEIIRNPYVAIGLIVIVVFVIFLFKKLPNTGTEGVEINPLATAKRLFSNKRWVEGVIAQAFYVAAQICCWTYVIHYAMTNVNMSIDTAQNYNIAAMGIFLSSRFICTFLLKYISPGHMLMTLALGACALITGTIFLQNINGLYCLVGVSACMSLMFPTIYGIALDGLGEDAKPGSAGLVFAIVGGALMPMATGFIIYMETITIGSITLNIVSASFVLPLISFIVIAIFGYRTFTIHHAHSEEVFEEA